VKIDSVNGAFCGYLLIAVAFGHLYCALESLLPGSFRGPSDFAALMEDGVERRYQLTYFSAVTLPTLGYADVTPLKGPARGIAVVEAVLGQFYIAVLVAELVGKHVAQALKGPPTETQV